MRKKVIKGRSDLFSFHFRTWLSALIVPVFILFSHHAEAQQKLKTPVKLNIEDGNFDAVSIVIKNSTTGETTTMAGSAKFDLDLKLNCDYVISFSKPGYITKKIELNTNAPADRVSQGFYPFNFEVNLFKQYDGVNIVVFNQPVGKISFNRLIDDFDYDTDYTKQIQSALKAAEDEIKKKQQEEKALAEKTKKEEEKKKADAAAQAKADAKAKQDADKKAAEEAKTAAAQAAKDKQLQEEQNRKTAQANTAEEKKRAAQAKMEEEERAKAKAFEEEEARKKAQANAGSEANGTKSQGTTGEDTKPKASGGSGSEQPKIEASVGSGTESGGKKPAKGSGEEDLMTAKADPNIRKDKGISKATGNEGADDKPAEIPKPAPAPKPAPPAVEKYEVLPDVSVEQIVEANRTITKVIVRKNEKETLFSKVVYNWGGIYYFRQNMSISESLYASSTGLK